MSVACRLLWETPQHPYGHPCGDGVAAERSMRQTNASKRSKAQRGEHWRAIQLQLAKPYLWTPSVDGLRACIERTVFSFARLCFVMSCAKEKFLGLEFGVLCPKLHLVKHEGFMKPEVFQIFILNLFP